ncbi:MAG: UDP-3-O-(3-hydroxymyristoyl)glucosamine N-acyltransferase [Woeseiaceae bacterium]
MAISLGDIATRFGCELNGDANVQIATVASLSNADSNSLSFLSSSSFKQQLATTKAAAVILRAADAADCPTACLVHENPYACYARVAAELHPVPALQPGVDKFASVSGTANVAPSAQISAFVSIGDRTTIGENTYIGPGCVIGSDCEIGANGRMLANVTVVRDATVGERFLFHPGTVIGCDGFGNAMTSEGWVKVPQLGRIRIGNDVEIGANCTLDLGALDDTIIDDGVRIDNLVHIAHNVRVGEHTAIAGQCGFSGSVVIGKRCMFGGQSAVAGHIEMCDDVIVLGKGMITKSIKEPGTYGTGIPAQPVKEWGRMVARVRRLGGLIERVSKLEKDES